MDQIEEETSSLDHESLSEETYSNLEEEDKEQVENGGDTV